MIPHVITEKMKFESRVLNGMKTLSLKSKANHMKIEDDLYTTWFLLTDCRGSNSTWFDRQSFWKGKIMRF